MERLPKTATAERQAMLLRTAAKVAKSVTTILDPDELLRQTVDTIVREFGFYYAGVFLLDDTGENAVLRAGYGDAGAAMLTENHKLKVGGNSMIGAATHLREARIALDVGEEAVFFRNSHLPDTHSEMGLPLVVGDTVLGALTVQSTDEAAFTQEDIDTLQSMADQLAIALNNARLHRENQALLAKFARRAKLLAASNTVGKQVASILDLDELLPKMVDIIVDTYGFYYAGVFLLDGTGENAVLRAGYGEAGDAMLAANHKLVVGGNSMIGKACETREARIALDVGEEAVFFRNPHLPNTRSEMALPMIVGSRVLGAVTVQSTDEAAFSQQDIDTLMTLADHLAVAIHNAQLLSSLAQANAELVRTKTYEALATATTEAIHWIGNKALPMTLTIGLIQQDLSEGKVDAKALQEDLKLIEEGARLIVQVKEQLLGPAREARPRPAMLSDVLATAAFHSGFEASQFELEAAADVPMAIADTTQLARCFANLFKNSLEAHATRVRATVTSVDDLGYVSVTVSDNGEGIPIDVQDKIWATFFTTKGPSFNGLGLAACLHIVTQMDGHISMESIPGEGATFTLLIPASMASANTGVLGSGVSSVALVDDDDDWSRFVVRALTDAGRQVVRVTEADGVGDAEVILVDDTLRAQPAAVVLKALSQVGKGDKAVVVTAALNVERTTAYMKAGARDVLAKPYTVGELSEVLAP